MSGYIGNPDAEAEHALIFAENGVYAAQQALYGPIQEQCIECGEDIDQRRVAFARSKMMTCTRCISCQHLFDLRPKQRIKMLDRIL